MPTIEIFPKENPNLASVTRTIAGTANMKNALNICTSCQVLHHNNGYPECDEFFFFVLYFCCLEKIVCIQIAQDPQKIKTMRQKFIKAQD